VCCDLGLASDLLVVSLEVCEAVVHLIASAPNEAKRDAVGDESHLERVLKA